MINLLPPQEKAKLLSLRREKLAVILGSVALIALVCLVLVLLSLRFYVLANDLYYQGVLHDIEKQYQVSQEATTKEHVKKYNSELVMASAFYKNQKYISDGLNGLLQVKRPVGLYFTNISMDNEATTKKMKLTVAGVSPTRDGLIAFKDALIASPQFNNVYFPPEAWVKPTNVVFYVTMEINQP